MYFYYFIIFNYCAYMYMHVYRVQKRVLDLLELVTDSCESLCGCWELNLRPWKNIMSSSLLSHLSSLSYSYFLKNSSK